MKILVRLRSLFLPASIGLLLVVAASWYYLGWLPSEHRYLDDRNFRLLTTLSEQISASINNFDKMMDNASDAGITDDTLEPYLKKVAPQLERLDLEDRKVLGNSYGDPPNITVLPDEGTHFLYFAFLREQNKTKYAVRTDLDSLIRNILPPDNRNPFDVVLLAQADGTVIFQKSSPGLAIARIDALEDVSQGTRAGKTEPEVKTPSLSGKFSFSRFSEITLAGARYRLYSQPQPISLPLIDPVKKSGENNLAQTKHWVLCGLVRAEAFRSESQSISYTYLMWLSVAILLVVAAYPFLRLCVSGPFERVRARDVIVTASFACVAAATVTFALLDVTYLRSDFEQLSPEGPMRKIAEDIDTNFRNERVSAFKQMADFYSKFYSNNEGTLGNKLGQAAGSSRRHPTFTGDEGRCEPSWACQTGIFDEDKNVHPHYPYLDSVSWSDSAGYQRIKWSTRAHVTPFIYLDDSSITYYPAVKNAFLFRGLRNPTSVPASGIGSQYSPNTGDYITVFWRLLDINGEPAAQKTSDKNVYCASVITRPISVAGPVMPAEFQFAIIKPDGTVIFHSDPTRNLRENFFAETDQNQEVRSRVLTRARGSLSANYMGRGHRLYVYPMTFDPNDPNEAFDPHELWTVIVFRDLRVEQTMNLEVLSLSSILFIFYALMMAAPLLLLTHYPKRGNVMGSWLWPDSRNAGAYRSLAIANFAAILLLLVLPELSEALVLLFCVFGVSAGALVINLVVLQRQAEHPRVEALPEETLPRWQIGYFSTISSLLAVVAVLPCVSFFKVAWDFEHRLFIERTQFRLAADRDNRADQVLAQYRGVSRNVVQEILTERDKPNVYFSYHRSFLDTAINPVGTMPQSQAESCRWLSVCNQQRLVNLLLSKISPLYNEVAYDSRFLTEAALASGTSSPVSSTSSKGREELRLTKQEPANEALTITSLWTPLSVPWSVWSWWLGTLAYMAALFLLVRFGLRKIFLLDLSAPDGVQSQRALLDASNLIATLPVNMLVIGRESSPTIANLMARDDVQHYDFYELLKPLMVKAATQGGDSVTVNAASDPVDEIVRDGRPVVFYNLEGDLDDDAGNQHLLSTLERVLSRLHQSVVIASKADPPVKSWGDEREQWQKLLQSFVRIDLISGHTRRAGESAEQFERGIFEESYYNWVFSNRSEAQKLVLIQLAQERLVNPNSHREVRELMREGLIVRACGMLAIKDPRFVQFLKGIISHDVIKEWESRGAGRSNMLRNFLLITGAAVLMFIFWTQGAVANTWITYATGIAASIPAVFKALDLLRGVPER
jgi:hypothetical protein